MQQFVHLQCYSEYSIKYGLLRFKPWLRAVAERGMAAVALTDHVNLCAMVKFYQQALVLGIKPIIGSSLLLENDKNPAQPYHITLLCKNNTGYKNLVKLLSRAYLEGQQLAAATTTVQPLVTKAWLTELSEGIIALAPAMTSDIALNIISGNIDEAQRLAQFWAEVYPDSFYLCATKTGRQGEHEYLQQLVTLAENNAWALVATNQVCFIDADDFEAHEARVCINDGVTLNDHSRSKNYSQQQYLKSPQEMAVLFRDLPEAVINSVEIAQRCNLQLTLGQVFLPNYPVPNALTIEAYLCEQSRAGLQQRLQFQQSTTQDCQEKYIDRLEVELKVINNMGFAGYFLIVADFIGWAKQHDIPVGPGRGSGAGSLVAYALKITDIDPMPYDLLFERFLNPERVSMPDFDIDFCMEGRDKVIEYVANKYGRDSVAQIMTFGTMAAKAVVRDVGRVLGYPYGFVDKIAKLIPFELGITLNKALAQEPALKTRYENEEDVKTLIDLAQKLEGVTRNLGKHAGGVVIAASQLTDYVPLYCEAGEQQIITQFDKNDVETVGLVKFDFLGLRTLTIIHWAITTINTNLVAQGEEPIAIERIPLNDAKTFALLCRSSTTAVFQLESRGMKDLIARLDPGCFEDIIALVALFRPGPLQSGMVDDFIARKKGTACIEYLHVKLESILRPTYGVILYQEQVMQIAQVLAGYTLGAADLLRKAMGKKKPEEMAKQRQIFVTGAVARGIEEKIATQIFELMDKFAGYGFNKSHSAGYALLSYQTAWLKTHYPAEFMAAVLSADLANTDKIVLLIDECRTIGLEVVPPDINSSNYKFISTLDQKIIYGLGAIKGVGEAAISGIITARQGINCKFTDIFDFCAKVDNKKVSRKVIEALIYAGAMDTFGTHRAQLMHDLSAAISAAEQLQKNLKVGQYDMFGSIFAGNNGDTRQSNTVREWSTYIRLQGEKDTLGLYLTGHPINEFTDELRCMGVVKLADLEVGVKKNYRVAGFVMNVRVLQTKRGDRMAFLTIDDRTSRIDVVVFADTYASTQDLLKKDSLLLLEGEVSHDQYSGGLKLIAKKIMDMLLAREHFTAGIQLQIKKSDLDTAGNEAAASLDTSFVEALHQVLAQQQKGKCPVIIDYHTETEQIKLRLGDDWLLAPSEKLVKALSVFNKQIIVKYEYANLPVHVDPPARNWKK